MIRNLFLIATIIILSSEQEWLALSMLGLGCLLGFFMGLKGMFQYVKRNGGLPEDDNEEE